MKKAHLLQLILMGMLAFGTFGLVACDDQGPAEEAGESVDDAWDDASDEAGDAWDDASE